MNNHSFDEKYFDSILCQVLNDIEEEEVLKSEQLYQELKELPPLKTSLRHHWRMQKILKGPQEKSGSINLFVKRIVAAAAVIFVVVGSTSIFASADIFRLFQWLGFYSPEYIDISLSSSYTQTILEETKSWKHGSVYVPSLIPEGYALNDVQAYPSQIRLSYTDQEEHYLQFSISLLGSNSKFSIDNKQAFTQKIKINGWEGVYFMNDSVNILVFNNNEYLFRLESDVLNQKELKKVAQNIEKVVVN